MKMRRNFILAFACLAICGNANAHTYFLTDGNSTVKIGPDSHEGMDDWLVDGADTLYRQQFFYRNGSGSGTKERTIASLNMLQATPIGLNGLNVLYGSSDFTVEVNYQLTGGSVGSGFALISEQIKISNISANPLDFHFFQYVDFDLNSSGPGDTLYLSQDFMGLFDAAYQSKAGFYFADEIITPGANRAQVDEVSSSWAVITSLGDNSPTTLNNDAGPVSGDAAWAIQWDPTIQPNEYFQISIIKSVYTVPIPEPTALAILSLAGVALIASKKRLGGNK